MRSTNRAMTGRRPRSLLAQDTSRKSFGKDRRLGSQTLQLVILAELTPKVSQTTPEAFDAILRVFLPCLRRLPPAVLLVVVLLNCELRVLRGTKQVGMALSEDGRFCVANYFPAGNMMGSFKENVLPRGTEYKPKKDLLGMILSSLPFIISS